MKFKKRAYITFFLSVSSLNISAYGQELFPSGSTAKAHTIASALSCQSTSCLLYNPANLLPVVDANKVDYISDLEIGFISTRHTYEHPDFDQVDVKVRSPVASFGFAKAFGDFGLGIHAFPTALGKQNINGLPRRIAGRFEALYVKSEVKAYDIALGGSYSPRPDLSMGIGVIRRSEARKIYAERVGDDVALMKLDAHNDFYIPNVGARYSPMPWLTLGLSHKFAQTKKYKGSQKAATSDDITSPQNVNYDPATTMFAFDFNFHDFDVGCSINYLQYSKGKSIMKESLTNNAQRSDLKNVWERACSVSGYFLERKLRASVAAGYQPSPWGDGYYSSSIDEQVTGVDFGISNNVTRKSYGLGLDYDLVLAGKRIDVSGALMHSFGAREVSETGDRPGFYQSETTVLSLTARYLF
jgi:hypothetical protein